MIFNINKTLPEGQNQPPGSETIPTTRQQLRHAMSNSRLPKRRQTGTQQMRIRYRRKKPTKHKKNEFKVVVLIVIDIPETEPQVLLQVRN